MVRPAHICEENAGPDKCEGNLIPMVKNYSEEITMHCVF